MVKITDVEIGSKAWKAGIRAGHTLVAINKNEINDVLDYRFYLAERVVEIALLAEDSEYSVTIKKGEYDDVGLDFETPLMDEKHSCKNGCVFCFIDQNPKGMRESIYFKDDDSRLSFIHGNYITLTNMTDSDVSRIIKMRISPINISIHTTNPDLRVKLMKNKHSGEVLRYLDDFYKAGLSMCGQIVLCRGLNDGMELERTLSDLQEYYPAMGSVAIVPAGLTKHRDGLYPLSDFTMDEAASVIDTVEAVAANMRKKHGEGVFYLADEFYLKAQRPIPDARYYDGYPQIENGVGLLRSFADEFEMSIEDISDILSEFKAPRSVTVATGVAAFPMLNDFGQKLQKLCPGLTIRTKKIINNFYGESITVSGLLTGVDLLDQLSGEELGDELLISSSMLKADEDVFLCGTSLSELSDKLGVPIRTVDCDGYGFTEALLGIR